uniref:Lipoprotein n=1 Tax=Streptomyces sp. NBC_01401 TaxID=2903854 RepID=A0AAU3GYH6_9ACTN
MTRSRTLRRLVTAVSLLPLLAACGTDAGPDSHSTDGKKTTAGSSGQLDIPADSNADLKKQYLMENAIAACMTKQGFTYTPVAPEDPADSWATDGADYALTKKYRQKYGFGIYAGIVYPDDAGTPRGTAARRDPDKTPNSTYVNTLTAEQKTAYNKALGSPPDPKVGVKDWTGCTGEADKKVYGSTSAEERSTTSENQNRANAQALNGDPKLVALAQSYASCLKNEGIPVTTTQPTGIGEMVKLQALGSAPAGAGAIAVEADGTTQKSLSKEEALPLLTKDIELATRDLECGKKFRAAYFPKFLKAPTSGGGAG